LYWSPNRPEVYEASLAEAPEGFLVAPMAQVRVCDDGVGIAPGTPTGVGLVSLRERAAELGGECRIECPDEHGTVVHARLPLALAEVTP